jgi:aspartate kinase
MNAIVLKFGGSSFLRPDDYRRVAAHIASRAGAGARKVVVVVSAMSGTTGNLKAIMLDVNERASAASLDAALATGEMLSACLLEAAISRLGIAVTSLNGYSLGVRTNSDFGRATIESTDPAPLLAALQQNDVVIAAGGQAIDRAGRLTMLGRNSSDLTAIVIASVLGLWACEIYSDVPGVYTADPYLVPEARLIPEIAFRTIAQMSRHGAKVLHHRAVDYAECHGIAIVCKSLTSSGDIAGTVVAGKGSSRSVTVARDAVLLSYASITEHNNIRTHLDQHDISAIPVEENGKAGICVVGDADFAMRLIAAAEPGPVSTKSVTLVAEFDPPDLRIHITPDYERAVSLARQCHKRMYPEPVGEALAPMGGKKRSAYSSLLTQANRQASGRSA